MSVIIETSLGDITIDLYTDERPKCCKNFLKLCKIKYYNFCLFHFVQRNFIAQTGDPTGTGKGGESVNGTLYGDQARYFDWEFVPKIKHVKSGLVSMVNNGNDMHGSQFFISLGNSLDYLDGVHTVFGEITEGFDVITKLNEAYCDEKFKPFRDIRIHHTIILDDPYEDPPGLDMPDRSPSPTPEVIERARLAADAELDDFEGKTEEEIREIMEEREERSNAQILEMIGDLPSTDITAPENVLFVCKLNSVTTDEDLEIIFSRFGSIKSCEVIRDHKTGESLQYAFIEFEKKEYCESAYFKMDNVLIDDRRIHVDFSQSVSRIKWKGKGKGVETFKEDPNKPKFIIKDKSQRHDNNYDLVFDEEDHNHKSSKKQNNDRSQDNGDDYRHKKKQKFRSRSRSPLDIKRRYRSPDRERRDDRGRREDRKERYSSPPRHRGDRQSPPHRHRDIRHDKYFSPERHKDDRRMSPHRHGGTRHMSPQRYRENRHMSPPRYRGDMKSSPPRHRGNKYTSPPRHRDSQIHKSPPRSKERRVERHFKSDSEEKEIHLNEREKNRKKKHDDSEEKEYSERKKKKKKNKYADSSDVDEVRKKKKKYADSLEEEEIRKKKKKYADSSDENEIRKKKKKYADSSDEDEIRKKKKKYADSSDENKVRKKKKKYADSSDENDVRKKKKKYADSSDENKVRKKKKKYADSSDEDDIRKKKKKKNASSDENEIINKKRKKKKKKKEESSSEDDEPIKQKHVGKKRNRSESDDKEIHRHQFERESPPGKRSDKHYSDKYKISSREKKSRDIDSRSEKHRKRERD